MAQAPRGRRVRETALARKNMDMDAGKLETARRILGARSDTEAVDRALDAVIMQADVVEALDRLSAAGGLADVYGRPARSRKRRSAS